MTKLFQLVAGIGILAPPPYLALTRTPGTGRVQIKTIKSYSWTKALSKPTAIVVYSFAATPEEVELNKWALSRARM